MAFNELFVNVICLIMASVVVAYIGLWYTLVKFKLAEDAGVQYRNNFGVKLNSSRDNVVSKTFNTFPILRQRRRRRLLT
uniref:Uncharacterized protein n=1 Tax=Octopus bimaculoides TaxID=37653 RepID=A0A0L8HST1_OCTBM